MPYATVLTHRHPHLPAHAGAHDVWTTTMTAFNHFMAGPHGPVAFLAALIIAVVFGVWHLASTPPKQQKRR